MNYSSLFLIPAFFLLLISCSERNTNIDRRVAVKDPKSGELDFSAANRLLATNHLRKLETPSEFFIIDNSRDTVVYGKRGTTISVNAGCLTTADGKSVDANVRVELKELFDKSSLVLNNKPTISDRKMLVTGGAVFINATFKGKPLEIRCPDGINISFNQTSNYPGMELFLGKFSNKGNINWVKDSALTDLSGVDPERYLDEENFYVEEEGGYYQPSVAEKAFSTTKFGWINCDAFYDDSRPKGNLIVKVTTPLPQDGSANMFLVFKNINSVLQLYSGDNVQFESPLLPEGEEVILVTIAGRENNYLMNIKSLTTASRLVESIALAPATEKEIVEKVKELN